MDTQTQTTRFLSRDAELLHEFISLTRELATIRRLKDDLVARVDEQGPINGIITTQADLDLAVSLDMTEDTVERELDACREDLNKQCEDPDALMDALAMLVTMEG